jgi:hypothetical protein
LFSYSGKAKSFPSSLIHEGHPRLEDAFTILEGSLDSLLLEHTEVSCTVGIVSLFAVSDTDEDDTLLHISLALVTGTLVKAHMHRGLILVGIAQKNHLVLVFSTEKAARDSRINSMLRMKV